MQQAKINAFGSNLSLLTARRRYSVHTCMLIQHRWNWPHYVLCKNSEHSSTLLQTLGLLVHLSAYKALLFVLDAGRRFVGRTPNSTPFARMSHFKCGHIPESPLMSWAPTWFVCWSTFFCSLFRAFCHGDSVPQSFWQQTTFIDDATEREASPKCNSRFEVAAFQRSPFFYAPVIYSMLWVLECQPPAKVEQILGVLIIATVHSLFMKI